MCSTSEVIQSKKKIYCLKITYNKAIVYKQRLSYLNIQWRSSTEGTCRSFISYYLHKFCFGGSNAEAVSIGF